MCAVMEKRDSTGFIPFLFPSLRTAEMSQSQGLCMEGAEDDYGVAAAPAAPAAPPSPSSPPEVSSFICNHLERLKPEEGRKTRQATIVAFASDEDGDKKINRPVYIKKICHEECWRKYDARADWKKVQAAHEEKNVFFWLFAKGAPVAKELLGVFKPGVSVDKLFPLLQAVETADIVQATTTTFNSLEQMEERKEHLEGTATKFPAAESNKRKRDDDDDDAKPAAVISAKPAAAKPAAAAASAKPAPAKAADADSGKRSKTADAAKAAAALGDRLAVKEDIRTLPCSVCNKKCVELLAILRAEHRPGEPFSVMCFDCGFRKIRDKAEKPASVAAAAAAPAKDKSKPDADKPAPKKKKAKAKEAIVQCQTDGCTFNFPKSVTAYKCRRDVICDGCKRARGQDVGSDGKKIPALKCGVVGPEKKQCKNRFNTKGAKCRKCQKYRCGEHWKRCGKCERVVCEACYTHCAKHGKEGADFCTKTCYDKHECEEEEEAEGEAPAKPGREQYEKDSNKGSDEGTESDSDSDSGSGKKKADVVNDEDAEDGEEDEDAD